MNVNLTSHSVLAQVQSRARLQARMETLQYEISSGTLQNAGQVLGAGSRSLISAYQERISISAYRSNIQSAQYQLETAYSSLGSLNDLVESLKQNLVAVQSGAAALDRAQSSAHAILDQLPSILSGTSGVKNPLLGQNGPATSVMNYFSPATQSAHQDFIAQFSLSFGGAPDSVDTNGITSQQISDFIDSFAASYDNESAWGAEWTGGVIDPKSVLIGKGNAVSLPTLTGITSLRAITAASVILVELGSANFNSETSNALAQKALTLISSAQTSLTGYRAFIGEMQNKIAAAEDRQSGSDALLIKKISKIESIDQNSAISELTSLKSQLELSYTMTSYLGDLLLANYIR